MSLEGTYLGHYTLLRLLGSGGMGDVYLAEDPRIKQQVAIKVIRPEQSATTNSESTRNALRLFQREARTIAALDHPHILPLFSYGEEMTQGLTLTYLVMPYRWEGSFALWLQQQAQSGRLLPLEDVGYFVEQAADALHYAHLQHVVHQDVKPSNFMLRANGEHPNRPDLLLTDFGIAILYSATTSDTAAIRGTPAYMAPEQWKGHALPASDQYALAIITYELLAGRPPFIGSPAYMMYQHINVQPQRPSLFNPQLTSDIDAVLVAALAKNPTERFQSIAAYARALQEAISNKHVSENALTYLKPVLQEAPRIEKTMVATPFINSKEIRDPVYQRRMPLWAKGAVIVALLMLAASVGFWMLHVPSSASENNAKVTGLQTSQTSQGTGVARQVVTKPFAASPVPTSVQGNTPSIPSTTDPYPPYTGTLALNDPLTGTSANNWQLYSDPYGTCTFSSGGYQIGYTRANSYLFCTAQHTDFSNFAYHVDMTFLQGDTGGIVFRVNAAATHFYYFHISTSGYYSLDLYVDNVRSHATSLASGFTTAVHQQLNQANLLAVVAVGNQFTLYVNQVQVAEAVDANDTYTDGQIGMIVDAVNVPTEAVFTNAKVWVLA